MGQHSKDQIAEALREIGRYLRLLGEDKFRARAYENAGAALDVLGPEFETLLTQQRLTEVPGIGAALAGVIEELSRTGTTKRLEALRAELPATLLALADVPGLTLARIRALWRALGVTNLDDLKRALAEGRVKTVKGFGAKTERKLSEALERYERQPARARLIDVVDVADLLLARLRAIPGVTRAELGGAVRRWKETVGTLRFVAAAVAVPPVLDAFVGAVGFARVDERTETSVRLRMVGGSAVELTVVAAPRFAAAWVAATGAKAHLTRLDARSPAWRSLEVPDEAAVYRHLGLPEIPPELREDAGEIEAAERGDDFGDLVTAADIRGMTHCHTTHSDGRATVREMAEAVRDMGKSYITITDHSPTAFYAGGVDVERLAGQWQEIAAAQAATGVRILRGTESDILPDGALDYPDETLARFEVIIASIHNRLHMDEEQMTARLLGMVRLPVFKIWGHALGRLVLRREPIRCRVEEILAAAATSPVAIEINGDPHRLDLPPEWIRRARVHRLPFVISTDAHSPGSLHYLKYGVAMARRGGVRRGEVLNALPAAEFTAAVAPVSSSRLPLPVASARTHT